MQHEPLQQTPHVRDDWRRSEDVAEKFGVKTRRPVQAVDAQVAQKDIHGFMEFFIQNNRQDNGHVHQPNHAVVQQSEEKQRESVVFYPAEAGQSKHVDYANIIHHIVRKNAHKVESMQLPPTITSVTMMRKPFML